jgi:hypothetical protein
MIDEDDGQFMRLQAGSRDAIHSLALHLEVHSQFGGMALDAAQAEHLANALRQVAETADLNALAYNHMCEALEDRMAVDARFERIEKGARYALIALLVIGLIWWVVA